MALADTYAPDYKKYYEAALGKVQNAYQTQRNTLQEQQSQLPYTYQTQRNQVANQYAQTSKALDETNAARGLYNSGTARTDLSRNLAARDTGINQLNYQQGLASQQLQNQLNTLGSQEATDIAALQGQEGLNERNYALQEASLTGLYNGSPTLASQSQTYNNRLALLQALQNYNLGVGQISDTLPQVSGYNYGDILKQLLSSLGSM